MEKLEKEKLLSQVEVLKIINKSLKRLGSTDKWIKAPEFLPEYEALKSKKVLIVDDGDKVIANILPEYIVATNGHADFVCHKNQSSRELAKEIATKNSDIILMDYNLANEVTGTEVIGELKKNKCKSKIIGHSSENRKNEFMNAGAIGCVEKVASSVSQSIKAVASLIKK